MTIKINGSKYADVPTYYSWDSNKEFPKFDLLEEHHWEIDADTLQDAQKWFARNHPDMYMGCAIMCENGDFFCSAVPNSEYGARNYETAEKRIAYVRNNI